LWQSVGKVLDTLLASIHEEAAGTEMPIELINLHGIVDKENYTRLIDEATLQSDMQKSKTKKFLQKFWKISSKITI